MKLTIVPSDKVVYIDRVPYGDIDMTWVPDIDEKKIHAVQWLDGSGEIEFVGPHQNLQITKLGVFENAVSLWKEKKKETDEIIKQQLEEWKKIEKLNHELRVEEQFAITQKWKEEELLNIEKWKELEKSSLLKWQEEELANVERWKEAQRLTSYLPTEDDDDDNSEADLFYDIEELLKEI